MIHQHDWDEQECGGIMFRYCPDCERLERNFGVGGWKEKKRIVEHDLTLERLESQSYHNIIRDFYGTEHEAPEYRDFGQMCWMCRKKSDRLSIEQKDWPEAHVNLCPPCYRGDNENWKIGSCGKHGHRWHPISANPKRCYRCDFRLFDWYGRPREGYCTDFRCEKNLIEENGEMMGEDGYEIRLYRCLCGINWGVSDQFYKEVNNEAPMPSL